ncbi:hypothetical protein SJAG_04742 [Schizosaccharomyces japonicus yFS275]|uniref:Ankyrin repeat protein n=1 Tax=Schizosaccharomyces japonicus (strain yFS275 / FY16936) TaxID=402676 RepID=B6K7M6_SCHJY|nr:hypothetical protein SJAG_04742 [Schizosaccharomyces japonicus yFS275]EEB09530.2 hypothetical protein SJAG_04742 [Schizosaccharomyces japonicus yFS275]
MTNEMQKVLFSSLPQKVWDIIGQYLRVNDFVSVRRIDSETPIPSCLVHECLRYYLMTGEYAEILSTHAIKQLLNYSELSWTIDSTQDIADTGMKDTDIQEYALRQYHKHLDFLRSGISNIAINSEESKKLLFKATHLNLRHVVNILLQAGQDPRVDNNHALEIAQTNHYDRMARELAEAIQKYDVPNIAPGIATM